MLNLMKWRKWCWRVALFATAVSAVITFHGLDSGDHSSTYAEFEPYILTAVSAVMSLFGWTFLLEFAPSAYLVDDKKRLGVFFALLGAGLVSTSTFFAIQGLAGRECVKLDISHQRTIAVGAMLSYSDRAAQISATSLAIQTHAEDFSTKAEGERLHGLVSGKKQNGPVYATLLIVAGMFKRVCDGLATSAAAMNKILTKIAKLIQDLDVVMGSSVLDPAAKTRKANDIFLNLNIAFASLHAVDITAVAAADSNVTGLENRLNAAGGFVDGVDAERTRQSVEMIRSDVVSARTAAAETIAGLRSQDAVTVDAFQTRGPWESFRGNFLYAWPYFFYAISADFALMGLALLALWYLVRRGQPASITHDSDARECRRSSPPAFVANRFGANGAAKAPAAGTSTN